MFVNKQKTNRANYKTINLLVKQELVNDQKAYLA